MNRKICERIYFAQGKDFKGQFCCGLDEGHTGPCGPMGEPKPFLDNINPSHYQGDSVMLFIEQFKLNFCLGNAVKYIARHEHKGKLEDLKKARWYLEREIANLERERS